MKINMFLRNIVKKNIEGISAFIREFAKNDGKINFQYLHKVVEFDEKPQLVKCLQDESDDDNSIFIGGEVPNSFCPLYEVAYFFQALLLSALGTLFLGKGQTPQDIRQYILSLTEDEIWSAIQRPRVSIICSLDTDIEPYRYVKHQLWRLSEDALLKRCNELTQEDFAKGSLDTSLRDIYWVDRDKDIAEKAMNLAESLPHAKALQYYLTIKEILQQWGINISNIPWYFNFVPKEEILLLGPENEILETLIALHEKSALRVLAKLTKKRRPWIIGFSCPRCGESSKKVMRGSIKADHKTTRLVCSKEIHEFRNELGTIVQRQGCGYSWEWIVPNDPKQLYEIFQSSSFTINFAARELLAVIKTTADCPLSWPVTQIGIKKSNDSFTIFPGLPKGYGDHRMLLTSVLGIQHLFTKGLITPDLSNKFQKREVLKDREIQLLAWASSNRLYDPEVTCLDNKQLHVTDTSALKALKKGMPVEELFERSIDINDIPLETLLSLRKMSAGELYKIIE